MQHVASRLLADLSPWKTSSRPSPKQLRCSTFPLVLVPHRHLEDCFCQVLFLADYIFQFYVSRNKLEFLYSLMAFVDVVTLMPVLIFRQLPVPQVLLLCAMHILASRRVSCLY